ncbi:MAG: glutathione synthase [Candidatus Puniceispirillales bacterium]
MGLRIAIQMDPIDAIDIRGDTTFALALEAQKRGHEIFVYGPDAIWMSLTPGAAPAERIFARGRDVTLRDEIGNHVDFGPERIQPLAACDVILMRQDPPFDMQYITATHLLEHLHPKTLVVNNPAEVRNAPEKLLITYFPDLIPPTLISRDPAEIRAFRKDHDDIIVKPLFGNGGAGVFHIKPGDSNLSSLLEMMLESDRAPVMVQQYLPQVRKGDKRVILIDGEAAGALNRIPQEGESRSNMHVGGMPAESELDDDDRRICAIIGPVLKERGLLFTGIDVIGGYLTEINVTSPTGLREIARFSGVDLTVPIWDAIEARR